MSKSKYGNTNLYMTTREFADILNEQNYFKTGETAHPGDICIAFSTVAETIGKTMEWAIKNENKAQKEAVMKPTDLKKVALPIDEEIAPTGGDYDSDYSEWKFVK
jgi:hypothetical protein